MRSLSISGTYNALFAIALPNGPEIRSLDTIPSNKPFQDAVKLATAWAFGFRFPCTRNGVPRKDSSAASLLPSKSPPRDDGSTDWTPAQR